MINKYPKVEIGDMDKFQSHLTCSKRNFDLFIDGYKKHLAYGLDLEFTRMEEQLREIVRDLAICAEAIGCDLKDLLEK